MEERSILDDAIQINPTNKDNATHFALSNRGKLRYLIALDGGKKRLTANLSYYSNRLSLLMRLLNILPFTLLKSRKLGYFVDVKFCGEISDYIDIVFLKVCNIGHYKWNMIAGTYDNKQKLVIQCFTKYKPAIYFKIGNQNSAKEMDAEMVFLNEKRKFQMFDIPEIFAKRKIDEKYHFNILVTKEFLGHKVKPVITDHIYKIFQEIASYKVTAINKNDQAEEGIPYCFSHGDFAPWNLKLYKRRYIAFDWEYCGMRFYGFDLIHYVFQIEKLLNGKSTEEAVEIAVAAFREHDKDCGLHKEMLKKLYLEECKIR